MRWAAPLASALLATTWAGAAQADKMSETLDISLSGRFAWLQINRELSVAPGVDGVDALLASRPHLSGDAALMGSILRLGATLDGVRFGFGVGIVSAPGLSLRHAPLGEEFSLALGALWGAAFEGYLGYTFGDPRDVRWLLEVRGAGTILNTVVNVHHAELGSLGGTPLAAYLASMEIRTGPRIPLGDAFFLETGIGLSPLPSEIGPERGSIFVTLGLPVPTANAF